MRYNLYTIWYTVTISGLNGSYLFVTKNKKKTKKEKKIEFLSHFISKIIKIVRLINRVVMLLRLN